MVLARRVRNILQEEGFVPLLHRGSSFLREKGLGWLCRKAVGSVVPTHVIKYAISRSGFLTTIYFYLNRTTTHEQRAVLRGHYRYHGKEIKQTDLEHRLIRHTHLLEKGLSTRESVRRDVFGEAKAVELVENIQIAWEQRDSPDDDQLYWTIDVLCRYFDIVQTTSLLEPAERQFRTFLEEIEYDPNERVPRPRNTIETDPVEFREFEKLVRQRTSTRWFQDRSVPRDELDAALSLAVQSPSACNRQSYEFRIYDDPNLLDKIYDLPLGLDTFKENIPCMVILVGKQRAYFRGSEKNVVFIDASLAAMTFQYALETRGLASCTINWPANTKAHERISNMLGLADDEIVITTMAVGYPDSEGLVPYSEKKDIKKLRSYNKT